MKTVLMSLVVLGSLNAFATTIEKYDVGQAYVVPSQYGVSPEDVKLCPEIKTALIIMEDNQQSSLGIQLVIGKSAPTDFASDGSSRMCMSDVVCPTSDSYILSDSATLDATRKNDGNYPTANLPGHTDLSVYANVGGKNLSCYYSLTEAK